MYQHGSLGDTIVTIPALRSVRRYFGPRAQIVMLHELRANPVTTPNEVLEGMGLIDDYIPYPIDQHRIRTVARAVILAARIRAKNFKAVVYLAPSERSGLRVKRDAFFFRLCGITRQFGFREFDEQSLHPTGGDGLPASVPHEAWFRLERLRRDGIDVGVEADLHKPFLSVPSHHLAEADQWLAQNRKRPELPLVAICPGCKQPANIWPADRFVELGSRLIAEGEVEVVVVGGPAERETAETMVKRWGTGLNAAGRFSPLGSAALLSRCSFMIGVDTGTTHLAAAQGIPCLAIYGCREEPGRFYPLGDGHIVLRESVPCAGCRLVMQACPVEGHPCMTGITVDRVWRELGEMKVANWVRAR